MTIMTVVIETPLGEATISGVPDIVEEIVKRCNAYAKLLAMCKALYDELTSYVSPVVYDLSLVSELEQLIKQVEAQ